MANRSQPRDCMADPGSENVRGEEDKANLDDGSAALSDLAAERSGENEEFGAYILPTLRIPDDVGGAEANFVQVMATGMWAGAQFLLSERGISTPALTVLVTDDIMAAADSEGTRIGIGADRRVGIERVGGGVVAAKTLLSHDNRDAVILLAKDVLVMEDLGQMQAAVAMAHEFSHVLYGLVRNSTVGMSPDCYLAWEVAEMLAIVAAEEFRCDRLALLLVAPIITATDSEGKEVSLGKLVGASYLNAVVPALDQVSPYLEDTIREYRTHLLSVVEMWNEVVRVSEGVLNLIAHAEGFNDLDELLLPAIGHRGASLLRPIVPLFEHLRAAPLLPEAAQWAQDRETLKRIGREGLMAVWAQLGLHPRPDDSGMCIEVTNSEI
jgi:hypothetical protein